MGVALEQARTTLATNDVPVGAVIFDETGRQLGVGSNRRVANSDPLAHAEIVAIHSAATTLRHYRLDNCTLVVTLEPCLMCAGAIMQSRISHIVFGTWDTKAGAGGSAWDVIRDNPSPHQLDALGGVRREECATLLTDFFRTHRARKSIG